MTKHQVLVTRKLRRAALHIGVLATIACAGNGPYSPNAPTGGSRTATLRVAVVRFANFQGWGEKKDNVILAYLPFVLYSAKDDDESWRPADIAKCLSSDLAGSKQFQNVKYFYSWSDLNKERDQFDLVVSGRLNNDLYHGYWLEYGLTGLVSAALGILSIGIIPTSVEWRHVSFEAVAYDARNPVEQISLSSTEFDQGPGIGYWGEEFRECPENILHPVFREISAKLANQGSNQAERGLSSRTEGSAGGLR